MEGLSAGEVDGQPVKRQLRGPPMSLLFYDLNGSDLDVDLDEVVAVDEDELRPPSAEPLVIGLDTDSGIVPQASCVRWHGKDWSSDGAKLRLGASGPVCEGRRTGIFAISWAVLACSNAARVFSEEAAQRLAHGDWWFNNAAMLDYVAIVGCFVAMGLAHKAEKGHREMLKDPQNMEVVHALEQQEEGVRQKARKFVSQRGWGSRSRRPKKEKQKEKKKKQQEEKHEEEEKHEKKEENQKKEEEKDEKKEEDSETRRTTKCADKLMGWLAHKAHPIFWGGLLGRHAVSGRRDSGSGSAQIYILALRFCSMMFLFRVGGLGFRVQ